jgi:hypothetical protein
VLGDQPQFAGGPGGPHPLYVRGLGVGGASADAARSGTVAAALPQPRRASGRAIARELREGLAAAGGNLGRGDVQRRGDIHMWRLPSAYGYVSYVFSEIVRVESSL